MFLGRPTLANRAAAAFALLLCIPAFVAPVELWHRHAAHEAEHRAASAGQPPIKGSGSCPSAPGGDGSSCALCLFAHAPSDVPTVVAIPRAAEPTHALPAAAHAAPALAILCSHFARGPPA